MARNWCVLEAWLIGKDLTVGDARSLHHFFQWQISAIWQLVMEEALTKFSNGKYQRSCRRIQNNVVFTNLAGQAFLMRTQWCLEQNTSQTRCHWWAALMESWEYWYSISTSIKVLMSKWPKPTSADVAQIGLAVLLGHCPTGQLWQLSHSPDTRSRCHQTWGEVKLRQLITIRKIHGRCRSKLLNLSLHLKQPLLFSESLCFCVLPRHNETGIFQEAI